MSQAVKRFRPGVIVQSLRELQERNHLGFLLDEDLRKLYEELKDTLPDISLYRIQEVASFFPHFRQEWRRPPKVEVLVCRDMSCHIAGADQLLDPMWWQKEFKGQSIEVEGVSCLGRCDRAPALCINRHSTVVKDARTGRYSLPMGKDGHHEHQDTFHDFYFTDCPGKLKADPIETMKDLVRRALNGMPGDELKNHPACEKRNKAEVVTNREVQSLKTKDKGWCIDYTLDIDRYKKWDALRKFVDRHPKRLEPPRVRDEEGRRDKFDFDLETLLQTKRTDQGDVTQPVHDGLLELKHANLLGMGGAGKPAWKKWRDVWLEEDTEKYVVCNGDESEPGTFKDRELLLQTPFLVVEGVVLGSLMTNACAGYIFIRHEYREQINACRASINELKRDEVWERIQAICPDYDIQVYESPGGYICGEQGALLEAMSDRRGQPRNRPPEPETNGLNDKPTVVNNVETLAWTPVIYLRGGKWYADAGLVDNTPSGQLRYKGRRLFSISGDLKRPGVYEVPIGLPFGELIFGQDYCQGMKDGYDLQAIATSGPSGGFLPPEIPHDEKRGQKGLDAKLEAIKKADDEIRKLDQLKQAYESAIESQDENLIRKASDELAKALRKKPGETVDMQEVEAKKLDIFDKSAPDRQIVETVNKLKAKNWDIGQLPLDLNVWRNLRGVIGCPVDILLGAGLVVYGKAKPGARVPDRDMLDQAVNCSAFFKNESCGKCVPCRIGSTKLYEVGLTLLDKRQSRQTETVFTEAEVDMMNETLSNTSICSLGTSAPKPLVTLIKCFGQSLPNGVKSSERRK